MTDYTITAGRSSAYPAKHYGAQFVGTRATFCLDADLAAPDANALASGGVTLLTSSPVSVGSEFFGMHVSDRAYDSLTGISVSTVRSHDMNNGKGRWKYIETSDNVWDFTDLDSWVNTHYAAGRDLVFTLYGTPTWASARPTEEGAYGPGNLGTQAEPSDMTKWDRFCTKIATRYLGKIKYYEVWNEPNQGNDGVSATPGTTFFFSGTFAKLSEMVRRANQAIKAVDPTVKILCPAITNISATAGQSAETYFTGMMAASDGATGTMKDWVDIIAVHLYLGTNNSSYDLAGMIDRLNAAKTAAGVSALPTWDTESAPIVVQAVNMTDKQMRVYLTRYMVTLAAKGVARTMYYQYDSTTMGFQGRPDVIAHWNQLRTLLMSGGILKVSKLFDGRLVYTTSGGQYVL